MKYILVVYLVIVSTYVTADSYDSLDMSFDDFIKIANKGNKSPSFRGIIGTFNIYNDYLSGKLKPQLKDIFSHAEKSNYKIRDANNIPVLVSIVSGCIDHAIVKLEQSKETYFDRFNIIEYALVMSCNGFIAELESELRSMNTTNREYLKSNDFSKNTYFMWAKSIDTRKKIRMQAIIFTRYLID